MPRFGVAIRRQTTIHVVGFYYLSINGTAGSKPFPSPNRWITIDIFIFCWEKEKNEKKHLKKIYFKKNPTESETAGVGGQAPSLAQELVKDWADEAGVVHPGLTDETCEDMVRWTEKFPHAIKEHFRLLEPRALRNKFFEAMKEEIPAGRIRMPVETPKFDLLVIEKEDEKGRVVREERKLGKDEIAAMVQIDLMKEEAVSVVRAKTPTGNVTYGLPPEKKNRMHDDRVYVLAMFCWWVKQLQIDDTLGEDPVIDYQKEYLDRMAQMERGSAKKQDGQPKTTSAWGAYLTGGRGQARKAENPFAAAKKPF